MRERRKERSDERGKRRAVVRKRWAVGPNRWVVGPYDPSISNDMRTEVRTAFWISKAWTPYFRPVSKQLEG